MHLGVHWYWSTPVFTPDGKELWAVGSDNHDMERHGNTIYRIYNIPLDGTGMSDYPPGNLKPLTTELNGRVPLSLSFSPDGKTLAMNTAQYLENCGDQAGYKIAIVKEAGLVFNDFPMPSLAGKVGPNQKSIFPW